MSMIPKGGDTIWGGLDWSPEGYYNCSAKKPKNNVTDHAIENSKDSPRSAKDVNYGRIISFGRDVAESHSSKLEILDFKVMFQIYKFFFLNMNIFNSLCFQWSNSI